MVCADSVHYTKFVFKKFTSIMFRFYLGGSISGTFERIKRDTLYPSKDRGLEVPDLGPKMKAFAVKHLAEFLKQ